MQPKGTGTLKRVCGFTLVDLLLSMVIIAASLGAIYGVFRGGLAAWNKGTNESILAYESTFLLDSMARDLRGAIFAEPPNYKESADALPVFAGKPDSVEFFTSAQRPSQLQWPNHRLKYYFDKSKEAQWGALHVKDTPAAGNVALVDNAYDEVIVDRVGKFSLRFLREGEWVDTWQDDKLPAAVEISVEMGSDDGRLKREFKVVVDIPAWKASEN